MAVKFSPYMPIQRTWVWITSKNRNFCTHILWESCWQSVKTKMVVKFLRTCLYSVRECGKRQKIAISVHTFYEKVVGNRSKTKIAVEFFTYMPMQRTWEWETFWSRHFCIYFLWESCWQSVEDPNGARVFPVYAYTAYVAVGNVHKSRFLYILSMGELLAIGRRAKWRSSFSRICLFSVRECG